MWTEIQNLKRNDAFIVDDDGKRAVTTGYVRVRGNKAKIFCVGYISPVLEATDMVFVVR